MLGEVGLLVTKLEELARTASRTFHCGKQAVQVPLAVCRSPFEREPKRTGTDPSWGWSALGPSVRDGHPGAASP